MLQSIRDNIQGTMAKIIIALIIIPFALFGVDSLIGGGGPTTVAEVNGTEIPDFELQQAIDLQKRQLLNSMGDRIQPSMLSDDLLRGPALQNLIRETLLLQYAEEGGLVAPASYLGQLITSMEEFQVDGKFSQQLYINALRTQGFTEALFAKLLSRDLLMSQLTAGVNGSDFVTPLERNAAFGVIGQQRSYRFLTVPQQSVEIQPITDAAIEAFYESNSAQFLTEERVLPEFLHLTLDSFIEPVSEEQIRLQYETEVAASDATEERHAAHILFEIGDAGEQAAIERAQQALSRIQSGDSFEAVAAELSDDIGSAQQGGDLGFTDGTAFPDSFEQALTELAVGAVSQPVVTDAGVHLVKLLEINRPEVATLEERRDEIAASLQKLDAKPRYLRALERLKDLVFNADGLSMPAKELGLTVEEGDWLSRAGAAQGLLAHPSVTTVLFDPELLEHGSNSDVIEISEDQAVVVRVAKHQQPEPQPLIEVADTIRNILVQQERAKQLKARADQLIADLELGTGIEELAKQHSYQWQVVLDGERFANDVQPQVVQAAFAVDKHSVAVEPVARSVALSGGDYAVIEVFSVKDGNDESLTSAEQQGLDMQLMRERSARIGMAFLNAIKDRSDISIQ